MPARKTTNLAKEIWNIIGEALVKTKNLPRMLDRINYKWAIRPGDREPSPYAKLCRVRRAIRLYDGKLFRIIAMNRNRAIHVVERVKRDDKKQNWDISVMGPLHDRIYNQG